MDLALHVKTFGKQELVPTNSQTPSRAYYDRRVHESGDAWEAEKLTVVTNSQQAYQNNDSFDVDHVSGTFTQKKKLFLSRYAYRTSFLALVSVLSS